METQGFDQKSLARQVELHAGELPLAAIHVALLEEDGAALVQMAEDAPAEVDAGDEMGAQTDEAVLASLHPHIAGHAAEDFRLNVGRIPLRVRREGQVPAELGGLRGRGGRQTGNAGDQDVRGGGDLAGAGAGVTVEEGVGQQPEEFIDAGLVGLFAAEAVLLERGVGGEGVKAVDLPLAGHGA